MSSWKRALRSLRVRVDQLVGERLGSVYFSESYRPPIAGIELTGFEPRRAEFALWYLLERNIVDRDGVKAPPLASLRELARVHDPDYLASLLEVSELARIFAVDESDIRVGPLWQSLRFACGGTMACARDALDTTSAVLNLAGGFHHASPRRGGGFCAVNDIAVAVAHLRQSGFTGQIAIFDLDAHPPDGTAECLAHDSKTWIGSISGVDWGPLPRVDEVVLTKPVGDERYLATLDQLLSRAPRADLAFVLAGGDVLADDPLGGLDLSLQGAYRRDVAVHRHLHKVPSVWLPSGGYTKRAWLALAGTGLAITGRRYDERLSDAGYDPLRARYGRIARDLTLRELGDTGDLSEEDIRADLHVSEGGPRLLGFYTEHGLEYAFFRYGIFELLEDLGYEHFEVRISRLPTGDNFAIYGRAQGENHQLVDCTLSTHTVEGQRRLHIEWLTLRHPLSRFGKRRRPLPGQDVPGLGLLPEIAEILFRMAVRLHLDGADFCPSTYHLARIASSTFHFTDPKRQGRFEALMRDLGDLPLVEASQAIADGRVQMNGAPYRWEADEMVFTEREPAIDARQVAEERDRVKFTVLPPAQ